MTDFEKVDLQEFASRTQRVRRGGRVYPFYDMRPGDMWTVPSHMKIANVQLACSEYRNHKGVYVVCRKYQGRYVVVRMHGDPPR